MTEISLPDDNHGYPRSLRAWQPGDGLTCTFASRASRNRPWGRPVAVRMQSVSAVGRGRYPKRSVVCAYHLSDEVSPGELSVEAENAAREKVIANHWDEYQDAIREFMQPRVDAMVGDLPDDLKALVLKALAEDDRRGAA